MLTAEFPADYTAGRCYLSNRDRLRPPHSHSEVAAEESVSRLMAVEDRAGEEDGFPGRGCERG